MKHHVYLQRSRKFITTSERQSFEVDSSRHAAVKSSQVEPDVLKLTTVNLGSLVILASSRVTFL